MNASRSRRPLAWLGALFAAALLIAFLLFGVSGCARHLGEKKAAERVNALLPQYIGRADKWDTQVKGDSLQAITRGHIRSVHIEGQNVQLDPAFRADSVTLDFSEVAVDVKAGTLQNVGEAAFSCRVGTANLNAYVQSLRSGGLRDLTVGMTDDRIVVTARPEVLGVASIPVQVQGFLTPSENGSVLDFSPDSARVSIVPVPGLVLPYITRKINPTIDLKRLRVPVRITQAVVSHGVLNLRGTIAEGDLLRAAEQARP